MARGRKALPDEIKALKGNPGKRRLVLDQADDKSGRLKAPTWLTAADEKRIFAHVAEALNRVRFVKQTDEFAVGRYSHYLAKWVSIKKKIGPKDADIYYETESKHGKMLREHPLWKALLQIEKVLLAMEDRIGLNPTSRQTILRGLINAPQLPTDGLFGEPEKPQAASPVTEPEMTDAGPLGFLTGARH